MNDSASKIGTSKPASGAMPVQRSADELIDLRFLFGTAWRGKWVILLFALVAAVYGYTQLKNVTPTYVARMVVMPSAPSSPGGVPQVNNALASFGFALGGSGGQSTIFARLELVLSSPVLARRLQERHGYMQKMFSGQWDAAKQSWIRPSGREFEWRERVRAFFNMAQWTEPTLESLARRVKSLINFDNVPETGFREVSLRHADPQYALDVLTTVFTEADKLVRDQDREEINQNKAYLTERLAEVTEVELQSALRSLLLREEQRSMLLQTSDFYVGRVVVPAYASSNPEYPNARRLIGAHVVGGIVVGLLLVILVSVFRRESA